MVDTMQQDIADDFRAMIRAAAAETSQTVSAFVIALFDDVVSPEGEEGGSKKINFEQFERGMHMIKSIRKGIKRGDLEEIFEECDEQGHSNITINELIDYCQRSISRARAMALKLRKAIIESLNGSEQFEKAYFSIAGNAKFADVDLFRDFAEDMLNIHINDSDSLALYSLYDTNGDGKVSLDDFLGFIHSHTPDAAKALDSINPENIVDIKVSTSRAQEADLVRQGYIQVAPDMSYMGGTINGRAQASSDLIAAQGTFGKGHSLWIWRAKQGTCCGKLRPIVDVQLETTALSTAMVVSGYTCLSIPIGGKWIWIKRAVTVAEELDSIVDIQVPAMPACPPHPSLVIVQC
jgi:Ca2+-binding EF-hand superfamily protein